MLFATSIDLTPVFTFLASLLSGSGPWGAVAGVLLLFVAQKLGGHQVNVSGWLLSFVKPSTATDKLLDELKQKLEDKVLARTQPTTQTVVTPPAAHPADEFLKWAKQIDEK